MHTSDLKCRKVKLLRSLHTSDVNLITIFMLELTESYLEEKLETANEVYLSAFPELYHKHTERFFFQIQENLL